MYRTLNAGPFYELREVELMKFIIKFLVKIAPWYFLIASIERIGWGIVVEDTDEIVRGLVIGTDDYLESHKEVE